ncbi:hypothetical protein LTR62_000001 [Meristemomyces frigidus]|uniref:Carbonic anhydrase n=1 Tax=Meristemomyces frigidus TaxID=1508187 RepID=A0AAN7YKX7_9PEZI|nr:hypothetical protein LTR62_000001 [Meristemomyces frigidus]
MSHAAHAKLVFARDAVTTASALAPARRSFASSSPALRPDIVAADTAFRAALASNHRWATETAKTDSGFFLAAAKGQSPRILWLGCSDSRVPETTVLGLKPGEIFTHRNIANIIGPTDLSLLAVIEFSVVHLKVSHIVVCGHTSCGGVAGCLANAKLGGPLDIWLQPLRALREIHFEEMEKLDHKEKDLFLGMKNVQSSVDVVRRIPTVIDAVRGRGLEIHGVMYHLDSGVLREVQVSEHEKAAHLREATFERK